MNETFHLLDGDLQCLPYQLDGYGCSLQDVDQKIVVESKKTHRLILVNTVFNYLNILMLLFDRIWSEQINRYDTNSKANAYTAYTV